MLNSGDKERYPSMPAIIHPVQAVSILIHPLQTSNLNPSPFGTLFNQGSRRDHWIKSWFKRSKLFSYLILGSGSLIITGGLASPSLAQDPAPAGSPPSIGFVVDGQSELNAASITDIEYRGECPGKKAGTVSARFMSATTPPAPGRRVIVRNVSLGVRDNPFPFTDRDYSQGRSSEATLMSYGIKQELRTFSVIPGLNNFEYEIKQGDRVIDKGNFQATIQFQQDVERRWADCDREQYCKNGKSLDKCEDQNLRYRTKCTCSGGRTFYRY